MTLPTNLFATRWVGCYNSFLILTLLLQKFDFGFEEEESIDGMKRLIVQEVNAFRAEVRAQAKAAGQIRRQDRYLKYDINL